MSYYLSILEKYEIFNFETFENVRNRYPKKNPAYLRKIIYLKGFKIKDGIIRSVTQEKTSNEKIKNSHCPECWSTRWVWIDEHSKIMCLDCGLVGERSTLIIKEQEKQVHPYHSSPIKKKKKRRNSIREGYTQSSILRWVEANNNEP